MTMQAEITATADDFVRLWLVNPLAREQLHSIILERLLREAEARLDALNASKSSPA